MGYKPTDPLIRFWNKVELSPDGCWLWMGGKMPAGYGSFSVRDKTVLAHRWIWQLFYGPVDEGLQIDHLCRVRHCVNPSHLETVTPRENQWRSPISISARFGRQTLCKNGHPFTHHDGNQRYCRICTQANVRRYYHRNLEYSRQRQRERRARLKAEGEKVI